MDGKALTQDTVQSMSPEMRAHLRVAGYGCGSEDFDPLFRRLHAMAGLLRGLDEHLVAIAQEVERRGDTASVVARGLQAPPPAEVAPPLPPRDAQDELAARVDQLQELVAQFIARGGSAAPPAAEAGLSAAQRERQTALERERRQRDEARNAAQVADLETNDGGFRGGWGAPK